MEKISVRNLNAVSKTLLLPLYFRALESKYPNPIIIDKQAENLVSRIHFDFSPLDYHIISQVLILMRVRAFDRLTGAFLNENPESTIINIGCGLDTRFYRVDNHLVEWYEMDFPEVIEFRRQFFEETDRYHYLASSVFDFSWIDSLSSAFHHPVLFLAEGVFMYFTEKEVKLLIRTLRNRFPGSYLIFDTVSPLQMRLSYLHPLVPMTSACFRWSLANAKNVENWGTDIRLINEDFYFDQPEPRLGFYNLLRSFPHIGKGFSIVRYKLGRS